MSLLTRSDRSPCSVVLWAAGRLRANPLTSMLATRLGAPLDEGGRVRVEEDLTVPRHPRVFVIGDAARRDGKDGKPLPGVSPVAMQQARTVAKSIRRSGSAGCEAARPSRYFDKGTMATIGRRRAIAMVDRMHMSGFLAWLAWLMVHIWYLIGFRSRLVVLITWFWSYVTYRRGARLITGYGAAAALEATREPVEASGRVRPSVGRPTRGGTSGVAAGEDVDEAADGAVPRVAAARADGAHLPSQG